MVMMSFRFALVALARFAVSATKPSLIFTMVDDWGRFNAGFHGNSLAKTPVMDALVRDEAILLERHYTYKYCSPTRRSFLSGRFPPHSGEINTVAATVDYRMRTIAERLAEAGYVTAHVGKWHAGHFSMAQTPHGRGFATSFGYFNGAEDHWTQQDTEDCKHNVTDIWDGTAPAFGVNGTGYGDLHFVERAVSVIEQAAGAPLFMYVALQCAHQPMEAPARMIQLHESAPSPVEYAMVSLVDEAVGNITASLKATGIWTNTLLIVASDNGGPSFSDQFAATNWPLRGGKYSVFEGGVRNNAFVTGGFLPSELRGKRLDAVLHVCDWYATFLGLAGIEADDNHDGVPEVDSVDQWPVLLGQAEPNVDRDIFLASGVLLVDRWKLITTDPGSENGGRSNNTQWSGPLYPQVPAFGDGSKVGCSTDVPCLFDVVSDPSEFTDLAAIRPDIVRNLSTRLAALMLGVFEGQAAANYTATDVCNATVRQGGYLTPADFPFQESL